MRARPLALCGVLAALAAALLALGGILPGMVFCAPILAMGVLLPVLEELGPKAAGTAYAAVSILALLLSPSRETAFVYLFFGWYPILRPKIAALPFRALRVLARLAVCSASALLLYGLALRVLGLAEDLLAQLQAAGDVEALFNQLVEEHGEDPGRAASSGYLVNPQTSFVQEFLDAAFALKPGELSGIVESDYGYHILLRKELTEEQLATVSSNHLTGLLTERMETALKEMTRSEELDGINAGEFYNSYLSVMNQLHPAETEDDAAGDGGDTATPGSTGGTAE